MKALVEFFYLARFSHSLPIVWWNI